MNEQLPEAKINGLFLTHPPRVADDYSNVDPSDAILFTDKEV